MADEAEMTLAQFQALKHGLLGTFDTQLASLYLSTDAAAAATFGTIGAESISNALTNVDGAGPGGAGPAQFVLIDAVAKDGNGSALLAELNALGFVNGSAYGAMASGWIAVSQLGSLLTLNNLNFAMQDATASSVGTVTTQADHAQHDDTVRSTYGVDGTGMKIGVISDSFDTATVNGFDGLPDTMAVDIARGDLGANTVVLQDYGVRGTSVKGTDEGRGMAQLVHDIAPGAQIYFATGNNGQAGFANNIIALANAGAKVIVDDLQYYAEPAYQNGVIAQAVNTVNSAGVVYMSSAGNSGVEGWEGNWVSGGVAPASGFGETWMQFAPGQDFLTYVATGGQDIFVLEWDDPAASAGNGSPGADTDLDLFIYASNGVTRRALSAADNIGHDGVEAVAFTAAAGTILQIRVGHYTGPNPGMIKIISFTAPLSTTATNLNDGTMYGHNAAEGANAIGAADFRSTPPYGTSPPAVEAYSSGGPSIHWYTDAGVRLASPVITGNVAFTAVDGGDTSFFGSADNDSSGFPNFFGTSAAAPDAAATALLLLQVNPLLTNDDIWSLLFDTARDMDNPDTAGTDVGYDNVTGAGLIQADAAAGAAKTLTITNTVIDQLYGTHLGDTITAGDGNTFILGGGGDDVIDAAGGNDTVYGGDGNDEVTGGSGNDTVNGDAGVDTLFGNDGDDTLNGNDGNDVLRGDLGNDTLNGGNGIDTATYAFSATLVTVDLNLQGAPQNTSAVGNDTLISIENLTGSNFNDVLTGDAGANVLNGSRGNDTLTGNDGDDLLDGGNTGNDIMNGGNGIDTVTYAQATPNAGGLGVTVSLATVVAQNTGNTSGGTDTITNVENLIGSIGNDSLQGNAGNNVLDGGTGTDTVSYSAAGAGVTVSLSLQGGPQNTIGAGIDTLTGFENLTGSGFDDTLSGDANNNVLNGGAGTGDTLSYANATGGVTVSLALATAQVTGGAGTDTISLFENLTGSDFSDTLTGSTGANTLKGGLGNDTLNGNDGNDLLEGGAGDDAMDGGNGTDTVTYANATGGQTVDLGAGTSSGASGTDTLANIENVTGTNFNDTISGNAGNNTLIGGAGSGDTVSYANAGAGVTVDLGTGVVSGGAGNDTISGFENAIGSAFDDNLLGNAGANSIYGGAGNDIFNGLDGADTLDAGDGDDFVYGGNGDDGLTGGIGNDTMDGGNDNDNLDGGDGNDTLLGSFGNDTLTGGAGTDSLDGGDGSDSLDGGDGDDSIVAGIGNDTLVGGAGADSLNGGDGNDSISGGDDNDSILGGLGADSISGGAGNDTINAGDDNDVVSGGAGDDSLDGGNGVDLLSYADAAGGVKVNLATAAPQNTLGAGTDTITGFENLLGSAFNDTLGGDGGNNVIEGGAGNDAIDGAGGTDTASYASAASGVTVTLATVAAQDTIGAGIDSIKNVESLSGSSYGDNLTGSSGANTISGLDGDDSLYGGGGNDTLEGGNGADTLDGGVADDKLYGGAASDTLYGGDGKDTLDGGTGDDHLEGGAGDDTYNVDSAGDVIVEGVGAGTDVVMATSVSFTLGDNIENLTNAGGGDFTGTGNALANIMTGGAASDTFYGGDGNDKLNGGVGADVLVGGAGSDTLTGGLGADAFVFVASTDSSGASLDTIADFNSLQGDYIDLTAIDANTNTGSDDAFNFIGAAAFSHTAGELRAVVTGGLTIVYGDTNGDGVADFTIKLSGAPAVSGADFHP